ncbi:MAG: DEAD/DEAH box helicase [Crocinitomicaceae bacterium]|nr:DEAD/DEAH box helicase [Crocinitomicaceae bacterium]
MTFEEINISAPILKALKTQGYTNPTPIQEQAIPIVIKGGDLLACAQTGTGKTAAFSIPILMHLAKDIRRGNQKKIRALIVTPTRELAIQISENLTAYSTELDIQNTVIFGGVNQNPQVNRLRNGVDILVATPGRLLDLITQGEISLQHLEIFVLDEADRMLDMGFIHDVKRLLKVIPSKRQSLFFSATMAPSIVELAGTILHNPDKVEVTPESTTAETIEQELFFVDKENKNALLVHLLDNPDIESVLVFTRTKHGADKVVKVLLKHNIKAMAIHGNKAQNARQRALTSFKDRSIRVLVATDIASRGIDVDKLSYVINFEIPNIPETYVHRIGRTGRAGLDGIALTFCDHEEVAYLRDIEKLIRTKIPRNEDHPFPVETPINMDAPAPKKQQNQRPPRSSSSPSNRGGGQGGNRSASLKSSANSSSNKRSFSKR